MTVASPPLAGRYDLVTIFEALHDMSYPVSVLRAARGLLVDGGAIFIGDERTEDSFTAPASEVERLYYGFSVFHCLPVGMVGEGAVGTCTVIRAATVKHYADEAGFSTCEVLPIRARFLALLPIEALTVAWRLRGLVFAAGAGTLSTEIAASRLLAPTSATRRWCGRTSSTSSSSTLRSASGWEGSSPTGRPGRPCSAGRCSPSSLRSGAGPHCASTTS